MSISRQEVGTEKKKKRRGRGGDRFSATQPLPNKNESFREEDSDKRGNPEEERGQ